MSDYSNAIEATRPDTALIEFTDREMEIIRTILRSKASDLYEEKSESKDLIKRIWDSCDPEKEDARFFFQMLNRSRTTFRKANDKLRVIESVLTKLQRGLRRR